MSECADKELDSVIYFTIYSFLKWLQCDVSMINDSIFDLYFKTQKVMEFIRKGQIINMSTSQWRNQQIKYILIYQVLSKNGNVGSFGFPKPPRVFYLIVVGVVEKVAKTW